ncbi:MAG TPA: hypothetical protein VF570_21310 [Pyrinomonadaceae bacterium]
MREVFLEGRACGACGALVHVERGGGAAAAGRGRGTFFRGPSASPLAAAARGRSGLAYAAGYAGVLSLFRYSFAALALSDWGPASVLGAGLVLSFSLLAPLGLVLSYAAAASLDRSPSKSGRLPALVGFALGWLGSCTLLFRLDEIWRWLAAAT